VNRIIAIVFVFLLSAQCIFKLSIITFFHTNRDYIADVLCINKEKEITTCYGQCFLDRNLAIADEGSDDKDVPDNKVQIETSIFIAPSLILTFASNSSMNELFVFPQPLYTYQQAHSIFHPPSVAARHSLCPKLV
jgi:hypothetical protein